MRASFIVATLVAILVASSSRAAPRPNVVLIFADDLGFSDLGCYGSEIETPNLDRLAAAGVRFTQFYNSARCCPSRAVLMTGRWQHQVGVGAMIDNYARWIREAADRPSYQDHLDKNAPTIAELLRDAGYRTLMTGKWHLGDRPEEWPSARGFDRSFALIPGAMNYWGGETTGPRAPMALDGERYVPPNEDFFATDAFTDRAIEFIEWAKGQPFFLYLAYNAPHWPLHAPDEDVVKYVGKYLDGWQATRERRYRRMIELGVIDESIELSPMDRGKVPPWDQLSEEQRAEWDLRMAIYAAQVERMDRNVGRLIEALRRMELEQNTLVLFVSDNGGAAEDPHRGQPGAKLGGRDSFWGYARPWATVSNTPFRYHKVTAYEGGISTPMIAHWPAGIPEDRRGTFAREPAHLVDLVPTFLELVGAKHPKGEDYLEGQSIVEMIKGSPGARDRTFYWEHEGHCGLRKGKWKLVRLSSASEWSLFNLETDRPEQHDLAATHPKIAQGLAKDYEAWMARCGVVPWSEILAKRPETTAP